MLDLDKHLQRHVLAVWGRAVTWEPVKSSPGHPAIVITGVFDRAHQIVMDEIARSELSAAGHSTTAPVLSLRLADLPAPARQGDRVTIAGEVFAVWDIQPDGEGWADLVLRQV